MIFEDWQELDGSLHEHIYRPETYTELSWILFRQDASNGPSIIQISEFFHIFFDTYFNRCFKDMPRLFTTLRKNPAFYGIHHNFGDSQDAALCSSGRTQLAELPFWGADFFKGGQQVLNVIFHIHIIPYIYIFIKFHKSWHVHSYVHGFPMFNIYPSNSSHVHGFSTSTSQNVRSS